MLLKVWTWLNGKKLALSGMLFLMQQLLLILPATLAAFSVPAAQAAQVTATAFAVVGVAHKAWKWFYHEDHA
jgi:hypothetical protein